jgi:hypothetical protein
MVGIAAVVSAFSARTAGGAHAFRPAGESDQATAAFASVFPGLDLGHFSLEVIGWMPGKHGRIYGGFFSSDFGNSLKYSNGSLARSNILRRASFWSGVLKPNNLSSRRLVSLPSLLPQKSLDRQRPKATSRREWQAIIGNRSGLSALDQLVNRASWA